MIFRHPAVVNPKTGKPGKRFRYGLGTRDDARAAQLINELNELLADERWWTAAARDEAASRFDERSIEIFFGALEPDRWNARERRDELLPLPTRDDGYRSALFVGTTGAGKTTVLRQLMGTHPKEERFPTTATGRTTVAEMEVVLTDDDTPYRAVVTFFPLDEVIHHLEECLLNAVIAAHRGEPRGDVRRALLRHRDERFRFNYILGDGTADDRDEQLVGSGAFSSPVFTGAANQLGAMPELGEIDLDATSKTIDRLVDRVYDIAATASVVLQQELDPRTAEDRRVLDELLEESLDEQLRDDDDVHALLDELVDEMRARFELAHGIGEFRRSRQGWPESWTWRTDDRTQFVRELRRFTSNAKPGFGRLLTPLVDGVRIAGPFSPKWWADETPKLVLYDTEGLGHTPESFSTIPTKLTRLIEGADAVVLVDNAEQPMQAASAALLRALATTGHAAKLSICFTHFDGVDGDNLPTPADQALHLLSSSEGVLAKVGTDLGLWAERPLRGRFRDASFYLANCHVDLQPEEEPLAVEEFRRFVAALQRSGAMPTLAETRPIYDPTNLVIAVRDAVEAFHRRWDAVLGHSYSPQIEKEHWARVKALSRRLAYTDEDGYLWLQPIADLHKTLQDEVCRLLQQPVDWTHGEPSDEEKQALFDDLASRLSTRLLDLAEARLSDERRSDWEMAYLKRGTGSAAERARVIADEIYAVAAPVPEATASAGRNRFLHELVGLVRNTCRELDVELVTV